MACCEKYRETVFAHHRGLQRGKQPNSSLWTRVPANPRVERGPELHQPGPWPKLRLAAGSAASENTRGYPLWTLLFTCCNTAKDDTCQQVVRDRMPLEHCQGSCLRGSSASRPSCSRSSLASRPPNTAPQIRPTYGRRNPEPAGQPGLKHSSKSCTKEAMACTILIFFNTQVHHGDAERTRVSWVAGHHRKRAGV